jgi:O-antigen ligase
LVGLAVVSVVWSVAPAITLRREVALLGTTLVGAYLAMRYEPGEQLRLLAWALGVAALLSLLFGLALPSYGLDSDGSWQGIFGGGKNALGRVMGLSSLVFLLLALSSHRHRWLPWSGFVLSVGLLVMANSVTSLTVLLSVLFLLPLYGALRLPHTFAAPILIFVTLLGAIAAMWLIANQETVLGVLGRDATFSNRTAVWPAVIDMIRQRPWLGYGYGAFWLGWEGESAQVWLRTAAVGLEAVHAHSGYLDLCINIGLLGATTFALGVLFATGRAVSWIRSTRTAADLWPLAYLTFMLLYNFTESAILVHNDVFWVLYVAAALSTATRIAEARDHGDADASPGGRMEPRW